MTLHYEDAGLRLWHGSNKDILRADALGYPFELGYHPDRMIPDESYDSIVTDPPYELGFMGKGWDSTGIAYDVEVWRECWRVLKPGGFLLAFGGTRTWHRIAVAIEDAGFEIRDSIAWMYSQGFPKSMDVATAVDKLDAAEERRKRALVFTAWMRKHLTAQQINDATGSSMGSHYVTDKEQPSVATADMFDLLRPLLPEVPQEIESLVAERTVESQNWASRAVTGHHDKAAPAQVWRANLLGGDVAPAREKRDRAFTDAAREWEGWGTSLKPAFEPIVVARKPFKGTVASNVLRHGTAALNIDACRVPMSEEDAAAIAAKHAGMKVDEYQRPAGVALNLSVKPMPLKAAAAHDAGRFPTNVLLDELAAQTLDGSTRENASRFFPVFRYVAKAPGSERPEVDGTEHATVKPLELMRWLIRLVTRRGGRVLDLFAGSGTTGEAALLEGCEVDLIELEDDHLPLILQRVRKPLQPSMFGDWEAA